MPFTQRNSLTEKKRINEIIEDSELAKAAHEEFMTFYQFRSSLVQARKTEQLTQKQLSTLTGLTQQTISRIETDNNNITLETLFRYLKGIGYDIRLVKIQ